MAPATDVPSAQRPPSPTELSYSRLVQLTPSFHDGNKNDGPGNGVVSRPAHGRPMTSSEEARAPSTTTVPRKNQIVPRSSPPTSITVPIIRHTGLHSSENNRNAANTANAVGADIAPSAVKFQTPQLQAENNNNCTRFQNFSQRSHIEPQPISHPNNQTHTHYPSGNNENQNMNNHYQGVTSSAEPVEDRVTNLALKIQAMNSRSDPIQNSSANIHLNNHQHPQYAINQQQTQHSIAAPSRKMQEIYQFIETLRNMQQVVSRTADEQQRVKKSRALNALLNMFESIVNERHEERQLHQSGTMEQQHLIDQLQTDMSNMEQNMQILQSENDQLLRICKERDEQLHELKNEVRNSHRERNQLSSENDRLRRELEIVRKQCNHERQRANEAGMVASESDNVRNSILSNYGRLTEENLELERAIEDVKSEKLHVTRDLEYCKDEVNALTSQVQELNLQIEEKNLQMIELEQQLEDSKGEIAHKVHLIQEANTDRQRLQNELHSSHRNSNSTSEQLLQLQDRFSTLQRENDALRRQADPMQSTEYSNLQSQLRQEQINRRNLEGILSKTHATETAAQDQLRKLARANAELKTKVNEMSARLSHFQSNGDAYSYTGSKMTFTLGSIASKESAGSRNGELPSISKTRLADEEKSQLQPKTSINSSHVNVEQINPTSNNANDAQPNILEYLRPG